MFCLIFSLFSFNKYKNTGSVQTFITPCASSYTIELYGAQGGGDNGGQGGYGGYVKARNSLNKSVTLNIYIGGKGQSDVAANNAGGGWNGGGNSVNNYNEGSGGGGGTDIRTGGTNISNRILVAGGGGGTDEDSGFYIGGNGGASDSGNSGVLFYGQVGDKSKIKSSSPGGGGGYYGGKAGDPLSQIKAYGGSNFINSSWTRIFSGESTHTGHGSCLITWMPVL